ncbi:rCG46161 [Rattus norvegicus]|uniref:RCG46161 n=1 Tax=Rattus norvegicus TaxID=10116 RepID=A6IC02_RAT|nr:rCG46161 [Rattus norvegicus]
MADNLERRRGLVFPRRRKASKTHFMGCFPQLNQAPRVSRASTGDIRKDLRLAKTPI